MSDAPNFASILDESPTEVNAPQPVPQGTYLFRVRNWEEGRVSKAGNKSIDFNLIYLAAGDDVDEEELAEVGGLEGKTGKVTFWLTEDAVYRLDEFHTNCGLDIANDGLSRRQRNDECINAEVMGFVKHSTSQDGKRIFANVDRTFAVEE